VNQMKFLSYVGSTATLVCSPTNIHAQEANDGGVTEIVVTAQKRAENVQDVPIAINAIGAQDILEKRITGSDDLVRQFPNLSIKQSSPVNSGFSIRGVGTQNFHVTSQSAIGMYADEISLASPYTGTLGLYDLERIEVLRGPQNTLFGRNTTGGAVNFISAKPDPDAGLTGYGRVNVGRFNRVDVEGAVGVPLGETLGVRGAFQVQTRDGPFTNVDTGEKLGSTRKYSGRLTLGWTPDKATEILLSGHVGYNRGSRPPRKASGAFMPDGTPCNVRLTSVDRFLEPNGCVAIASKNGSQYNPSLAGWRNAHDGASTVADVDYEGGYLRLSHDFGGFSLTNITAYDRTSVNYVDGDGLPFVGFQVTQDATYDVFSHETRLASTSVGPFQWLLGAYYSYEKDNLGTIVRNGAGGPPAFAATPFVFLDQKTQIYSIYGQADYDVTDALSIGGGLRWTRDAKAAVRYNGVILDSETGQANAPRLPTDFLFTRKFIEGLGVPSARANIQQEVEKVAGKIGLKYKFIDDVMMYANYSTGFKSGSFDVRALAIANGSANSPVRPESIEAYEVGFKSSLLNRKLQFNAAMFHYDWKDLQAFAVDPVLGPVFINLPRSRLQGVEAELAFAPGGGLNVNVSGAYLDSKVIDVGTLAPSSAIKGAPIQQAPKWTFNGDISQSVDIGSNLLTARVNARYSDEQFITLTADPVQRIKSATFVDSSISFDFGTRTQHKITVYADNILSERTCYSLNSASSLTGVDLCNPNEGTVLYGMTFSTRW
jgi:iron complex outermembrane receptor protein